MVLLRREMRRRIGSETSRAEACECDRGLRAVVLRPPPWEGEVPIAPEGRGTERFFCPCTIGDW